MNSEEDEFNRIEREASLRKAAVKSAVGKHTIDMAREAAGDDWGLFKDFMPELKAFEALVRADERNSWPSEMEAMERQVNILTDALAQASKDAARYQVLRTWDLDGYDHGLYSPEEVDKAVDDCIKDHTCES